MNRLIPTAVPLAFALLLSGCDVSSSSKPDPPDKRPAQMSMITAADEIAARGRLLAIVTAEAGYQATAPSGEYATLDELIAKGFITDPSAGKLARYRFEVKVTSRGFEATAVPEKYGVTGNRSFFVDETRVIRGADRRGEKATSSDPEM
jgi:hypothetical protein